MAQLRSLPLSLLASTLLCSFLCTSPLMAQSSTASQRIVSAIDESSRTTLKGNVPHLARAEFDQGAAAAATQLTNMRLVLSRSDEQQVALDKYLAELQDKSSPNYHKWLTPEQFGKLYGPADSDVAAIVAWLESHGLTLEQVSTGRTNVAFSGTVSQIEEAFHTPIHSFTANGQQFYSNTANPGIPSALSAVIKGVAHLNTIKPRPQFVQGKAGMMDPQTRRLAPVSAVSAKGARPNLTLSGTSGDTLYLVPGDAATIYNTPNTTFNANYSGTNYTGSGVKIGIGGDATISASIVASYRSKFLGNSTAPIIRYCTSATSCSSSSSGTVIGTDDSGEAYLDTELSGGLAPGATIYYYASSDLFTGIDAAITANLVDIFSLSFGVCEQGVTTSDNAQYNSIWEQAAAQGIAVTVSSGDNGSAGCDNNNSQTEATGGLQVNALASTPYNIAVGGTDFKVLNNSFSSYVNTSQGSPSTFYRTALSYIPESTWNDSNAYNSTISANVPWSAVGYPSNNNIVGGSGGKSSCSTNSGGVCISGYPKPSWQVAPGVLPDGVRDLPDISLMSGVGVDSAVWLVCTNDPVTGTSYTTNCATQSDGSFYFVAYGGTSTAAPAFAGMLALVQQKSGSRLGQAAQVLYALYNGSHSSSIFHDVTDGNISVPCTQGTPDCALNAAGYYFESGYDTTTGYDLATGLGSVDVAQLINYWSTATGTAKATVTVVPASSSLNVNAALNVSVTVAGSGSLGTPTGTVTLSGGGYTSSAKTLANGSYTFTIPVNSLSSGSDTLTVYYSGNTSYATASGTANVTVIALTPTVTVTPAASSVDVSTALNVTATVTGTGATPTGTVTISSGSYTSPAQTLSGGSSTFTIPAGSLSPGSYTLTVTYSGDSSYSAKAGTAPVTITKSTPWMQISDPGNYNLTHIDKPLTLSVYASGCCVTLTGTITISSGAYTSPAMAIENNVANITIPAYSLPVGSDTVTATYSGDSNYFSATKTATVIIIQPAPTVTVTPAASSVKVNAALNVTATVTSTGVAPTGTAILSAGNYISPAQTLVNGSAAFTVPAYGMYSGTNTILTVTYSGDTNNSTATGSATVTVVSLPTTVTVTPAANSIGSSQSLNVTVAVTDPSGAGTPTGGVVTLSSGGYSAPSDILTNGSSTFTIPAGSLNTGTDTLTVNYGGDAIYASSSGTANVTVTQSIFTLSAATASPASIAPGASSTSTVSLNSFNDYSGTVTLSCAVAPTAVTHVPTCSVNPATIAFISGLPSGQATVTVHTTAATAALAYPKLPGKGWAGAGGGAVLAFLVFLGVPARRRNWLSMLGVLMLMAALVSLAACGGGGSTGGGGGGGTPGTTAGTYTFTVTGTGNPSITPAPTTTFTVTVNLFSYKAKRLGPS